MNATKIPLKLTIFAKENMQHLSTHFPGADHIHRLQEFTPSNDNF